MDTTDANGELTFIPPDGVLSIVAVDRIPVFFADVMIVVAAVVPCSVVTDDSIARGGGFDLNAVIVIPPLFGDDTGTVEDLDDFFARTFEALMGSITKLPFLVVAAGDEWLPVVDAGITCNDDDAPVAELGTLIVGVLETTAVMGGSGIKPLRLASISATFLRSTCVGLAVPLM